MSISNDKLTRRASHVGWDLSFFAILAGLCTFGALANSFRPGVNEAYFQVLAGSFFLATLGFRTLAEAARRGSIRALGMSALAMFVYLVYSLVQSEINGVSSNLSQSGEIGSYSTAIIVFLSLMRSRGILLELRRRGLWGQVFRYSKPSRGLCLLGGLLLVAGVVGIEYGAFYVGKAAIQENRQEMQIAQQFVYMLNNEEKAFMETLKQYSSGGGRDASKQAVLTRLDVLERRAQYLLKTAQGHSHISRILQNYCAALPHWRRGIQMLGAPAGDPAKALAEINYGDRLAEEAADEFNQRFVDTSR